MSMLSRFATLGGAITDPYWSYVTLLLTGDTLSDSSSPPKTIINTGSVTVNTSIKKYGTGALSFNGSSNWLSSPVDSSTGISGTINFTIEGWLYPIAATSYHCFYSSEYSIQCYMTAGRLIEVYIADSTGSYLLITSSVNTIPLNTWSYVALVRKENSFYIFINGNIEKTATLSGSIGSKPTISIGTYSSSTLYPFNGLIDEFRITRGIARYTASFTPPSRPFPIG